MKSILLTFVVTGAVVSVFAYALHHRFMQQQQVEFEKHMLHLETAYVGMIEESPSNAIEEISGIALLRINRLERDSAMNPHGTVYGENFLSESKAFLTEKRKDAP